MFNLLFKLIYLLFKSFYLFWIFSRFWNHHQILGPPLQHSHPRADVLEDPFFATMTKSKCPQQTPISLSLVHSPSFTVLDTVSYPAAATSHSLMFFIIIIIINFPRRGSLKHRESQNVKLYKYLYNVYECTDESSVGWDL